MGRSLTSALTATVTSTPPIGTISDVFTEGKDYALTRKALSRVSYPALSDKFPTNISFENNLSVVPSFIYEDVAYGNDIYVAVGVAAINAATTLAYYSMNGTNWLSLTLPASLVYKFVKFENGLFIAGGVADTGLATTSYITSVNGINWVSRVFPTSALRYDLAYSFGLWISPATTATSVLHTSPDGITWTARTLPSASNWKIICTSGSLVLVVAPSSTIAATSPDGITWTSRTLASTVGSLLSATYGAGLFVVADSTNIINTSPDGITWTSRTVAFAIGNEAHSLTYENKIFMAAAPAAQAAFVFSLDGIKWEQIVHGGVASSNIAGFAHDPIRRTTVVVHGGGGGVSTQAHRFWKSGALDDAIYINGTANKYVRIT